MGKRHTADSWVVKCRMSHVECRMEFTQLPNDLVSGSVGKIHSTFDMGHLTADSRTSCLMQIHIEGGQRFGHHILRQWHIAEFRCRLLSVPQAPRKQIVER